MNSAPIAIDWSMRAKVLVEEIGVELRRLRDFSASTQIAAIVSMVSTGYLPAAVSAREHHGVGAVEHGVGDVATLRRASAPGAWIIDSIICVAVMTSLFDSRAMRIMRFCSAGTAALPTSTARSPRATMMPSRRVEDVLQRRNRLGALDLGDHLRLVPYGCAGDVRQLARHFHVGGVLREATPRRIGAGSASRS